MSVACAGQRASAPYALQYRVVWRMQDEVALRWLREAER
jgi:hypothetical protein